MFEEGKNKHVMQIIKIFHVFCRLRIPLEMEKDEHLSHEIFSIV